MIFIMTGIRIRKTVLFRQVYRRRTYDRRVFYSGSIQKEWSRIMQPGVLLTSERLELEVLDGSGAGQVLDYYLRNREFLSAWEPARSDEFFTLDYHETLLEAEKRAIDGGGQFKVWLREKVNPGELIGSISLSNIVRVAFQSCHLGYKLDGDKLNRGYMTEALRAVIEYGFSSMALHRIEANIMPHNKASLRVVEKLGFYHEGLAYKYLKINGRWEDHIHMVLRNQAMEI